MAINALHWISGFGGPLILLDQSLLHAWGGLPEVGDPDPLDPHHDYGRACACQGFHAVLPVGSGQGLVLCEGRPAAWWPLTPDEGVLVQWLGADSDAQVINVLRHLDLRRFAAPTARLSTGGRLLLFDSVHSGAACRAQGKTLEVSLPPGQYEVRACLHDAPGGPSLVLHHLRRVDHAGG